MAEGQRDEFKPCPRAPAMGSSFASANLFFLPSASWLRWVLAGGLEMLSPRGEDNHSCQNAHHSPGSSLLLHSPQRRFSPLCLPESLGASLAYKLW